MEQEKGLEDIQVARAYNAQEESQKASHANKESPEAALWAKGSPEYGFYVRQSDERAQLQSVQYH